MEAVHLAETVVGIGPRVVEHRGLDRTPALQDDRAVGLIGESVVDVGPQRLGIGPRERWA